MKSVVGRVIERGSHIVRRVVELIRKELTQNEESYDKNADADGKGSRCMHSSGPHYCGARAMYALLPRLSMSADVNKRKLS